MKLYYGGFADYMEFVVAEDEVSAISKVGIKINAPFLPITVTEIAEVDGYNIQPVMDTSGYISTLEVTDAKSVTTTATSAELRHCKKCDFTCATQGELLKHYRENHPKGD